MFTIPGGSYAAASPLAGQDRGYHAMRGQCGCRCFCQGIGRHLATILGGEGVLFAEGKLAVR